MFPFTLDPLASVLTVYPFPNWRNGSDLTVSMTKSSQMNDHLLLLESCPQQKPPKKLQRGLFINIQVWNEKHQKNYIPYFCFNYVCFFNTGEITYLALGPLTNLAKTFEQNPDLSSQLSEIVIMGGNSLAAAANQPEFNFQMDTASADYVLRNSECKTTLVTADFCEKISKSFEVRKQCYTVCRV